MTLTATPESPAGVIAGLEDRLRPPPLPPVSEWRTTRIDAQVTIEAVAAAVGVSVMTVSRWERGLNFPWRRHWAIYAQVLHALRRIAESRSATQPQK